MINFINFSKWWIGLLSIIVFQIPLLAQSGINGIGGFEQDLPSYWTKGAEPSGATLSWATDEFRSMGKSLKIEKGTTSEAAMWESENMVDLWSEKHFANVDIKFGMYFMTSGVNTNPTTEDEKWKVSFTFLDSAGAEIGVWTFDIDQSVASSAGWVADTTDVGIFSLPEDSWTTIIRFIGGKDATGTVWTDDYIFTGREGWAGQDWNTQVGVPTGWYYWMPPIGGNDGELNSGFENSIVTDAESHSGIYSLKFDMPVGRETRDGFVSTRRFELDDAQPGQWITISVWVKGENLDPVSADTVGQQWSIALSATYHTTSGNNEGFNQYGNSDQIALDFQGATSFDWTQFQVNVRVKDPPQGQVAKSISIRLHVLTRFEGTVWMDDLEITAIPTSVEDEFLPVTHNLFQNYPNPFNPSTIISYAIPNVSYVSLKIYDMLGREVKTLVNSEQNIGTHSVQWNGDNNYGNKVSSGIYQYKIEAGNFIMTKKMILLK